MIEIRSFQNSDLPKLAELWCIHHATYRNPPLVNASVFEQAVAARLFFDASCLLVAIDKGQPIAWCQWFAGDNQIASLVALCFQTTVPAVDSARLLLAAVERDASLIGMKELRVGVHYQSNWGYQGLEPIGHGVGIDMADDRTNTMLEGLGYHEARRIDRWEVATSGYRPPINRDLLAFRRSTSIQRDAAGLMTPHLAAAMVHLDIERHSLVDSRSRAVLAAVEIWTSDPEALVMPAGDAILGNWMVPQHGNQLETDDTALRYLIASLIPQLAERRIRSLQRSVATDNKLEATTLLATNFSRTNAGRILAKNLP
jgi:hypothetical protein